MIYFLNNGSKEEYKNYNLKKYIKVLNNYYYILIYKNSIDEYIDHMLKYKTKVSDNLLDGKSFNEENLKKVKNELITKILQR